jgi:2-polyprenyl-6-methoxyphenol hydroxylase-like FAD-dependent oxidoreductase
MDMRIGIIGAGIGGLCAAIGLKRAGADVALFEQANALRASGSGLSIFGNGLAALAALGLAEPFMSISQVPQHSVVGGQRDPDGRWLSRTPPSALAHLHIVGRQELHEMLGEAVSSIPIHLRSEARGRADGVIRWTEHDGENEASFDLIVAADGINSFVRQDVWGEAVALRYAGYSAWRGITREQVDLHGQAGESWGRGERFGIAPLQDGRVYWFAVAGMRQNSIFPDEYEEVQRRFGTWHDPIAEILAKTNPADVCRHDICDLAQPLASYVHNKVVLLGDAAHAMTPDLGQGANMAIEDAATLVALLAPIAAQPSPSAAELTQALMRYDKLRRPRTQAIARQARQLGAFAQAEGMLGVLARNLLMRLVPPQIMGMRLLALQRWQPPTPSG